MKKYGYGSRTFTVGQRNVDTFLALSEMAAELEKRNNGKSGELDNDRIIDNFYPASVKAIASPRVE